MFGVDGLSLKKMLELEVWNLMLKFKDGSQSLNWG